MQNDFDANMAGDENAYGAPDVDIDDTGDDGRNVVDELEERLESQSPDEGGSSIAHILRSLFDVQDNADNGERNLTPASPSSQRTVHLSGLTLEDLVRLLGGPSSNYGRSSVMQEEDEGDGDGEEYYGRGASWNTQWFPKVTKPQKPGVELLLSGEFGRISAKTSNVKSERNLTRLLLNRVVQPRKTTLREEFTSDLIPNSNGTAVASYGANIYCGQFSKDSTFYYTCCQDFRLHIYDMTGPPTSYVRPIYAPSRRGGYMDHIAYDHETTLKVLKTIQGGSGRWTITDSHLSPDNERIIYSSISPTVYMTSTLDTSPEQIPIRFSDPPRRSARLAWGFDDDSFGIWSCRFSADGREVVAGGSGQIFVYDLLADRRTVRIRAHDDDVNSCCWADATSGNVLISASDDALLKVWDRRSLGASRKPSGVLVGHTEGITNVSAKGDGRYVISNGKDQALRLWDLRKMCTSEDLDNGANKVYRARGYDYRYGHYPKPKVSAHPKDCSVMTYRGHAVLRTLIRCHFSPAETTGSQYLYSGSADGKIHIWSLDGRVVQVLDRSQTLPMTYDPSAPEMEPLKGSRSTVCVRDVSWHSQEPVMMSAGWEGDRVGGSIVARHEWKGLLKTSLEDWVEKDHQERRDSVTRRRGDRIPGAFESDESFIY